MITATRFVVQSDLKAGTRQPSFELCEHKGIGHPDSLCDGAAEAVSRALCRAYLKAYGSVQHYNVDKALLVGGESAPRFGGGRVLTPPRLIVCGRATPLPDVVLENLVCAAALEYLATVLHCDPPLFTVESAVRGGSPNLQRVIQGRSRPRANDTSFGAGFAPFSRLESTVLRAADVLRSPDFRAAFPAAGDDYKVMGASIGDRAKLIVALALVDREVLGVDSYFAIKSAMVDHLLEALPFDGDIAINALDDPSTHDESGVYLTVTGLSTEHGDDGQVGRGNRVSGLITPGRPMSLEAAAGKNAVAHVGKIYNVLAQRMAQAIAAANPSLVDVSVQMLSSIGTPVDEPELVAIRLAGSGGTALSDVEQAALDIARCQLREIDRLLQDLIDGRISVF